MAELCHDLDINVHEMVDASMTKGHSIARWNPGPGVGGHCGIRGTLVMTEYGPRAIETIQKDDRVIAADGKLHSVVNVFEHAYVGDVTIVKVVGAPAVKFTPEHEFYVASDHRPNPGKDSWTSFKDAYGEIEFTALTEPVKVNAEKLEADKHYMFYPDIQGDPSIKAPAYVTEDYIRFLGWFASEGSLFIQPNSKRPRAVTLGLHTDELEYHEEIRDLLPKVSGNQHVSESIYKQNHSHVLKTYTSTFAERVLEDCGRYQEDRFVPSWILFGEEKWIPLYLRGLFCGDAMLKSDDIELTTTSSDLAYGAVLLLNRLGITASMKSRHRKNRRPSFEVSVAGADHIQTLYDLIGVTIPVKKKGTQIVHPYRNGKTFSRISSVTKEHYEGQVYDLEVEDDHTYLTSVGIVSNCLPIDPLYLSWVAKTKLGKEFKFGDLADSVNKGRPIYVVDRAEALLQSKNSTLKGADVLVLGVAYKPNVGDIRESPALDVVSELINRSAKVLTTDPHVTNWTLTPTLSIEDLHFAIGDFDLVILVTDHAAFDFNKIRSESKLVLDCRNVISPASNVEAL
jgi:UDP-glucose 6-dehydrogenase